MRSDKELLQLLLDNKQYFSRGLCALVTYIYRKQIVSYEEFLQISLYIYVNAKTPKREKGEAYYWPICKWKPREKWIKSEIKKLNGKKSIFTIIKGWVRG